MKNANELAIRLNDLINDFYARRAKRLQLSRYFPKQFITSEPFEDKETMVQLEKFVTELSKGKSLDLWKVVTRDEK